MKIAPIAFYKEPPYPTAQYLESHPELLRAIPERWRTHPAVLTALATVCALLGQQDCEAAQNNVASKPRAATTKATNVMNAAALATKTAPIFKHGDGRGGFGCVAVAAPTFLSEEEARQVIADEAKKAGLTFQTDVKELKNVMIPATDPFSFLDERDDKMGKPSRNPRTTVGGTLRLDGTDTGKHISYEFVSKDDFKQWEQKDLTRFCTVYEYNLMKTAETLRAGLAQSAPKETVAVFYDPVTYIERSAARGTKEADAKKAQQQTLEKSKEDLRKQVRDFIAWLKAQGVI